MQLCNFLCVVCQNQEIRRPMTDTLSLFQMITGHRLYWQIMLIPKHNNHNYLNIPLQIYFPLYSYNNWHASGILKGSYWGLPIQQQDEDENHDNCLSRTFEAWCFWIFSFPQWPALCVKHKSSILCSLCLMIDRVSYLILQFREQDTQVHQYRKECADACLSFLLILPNQTKIYEPDLHIVVCVIHANTCF